jgi:hypothetical protein
VGEAAQFDTNEAGVQKRADDFTGEGTEWLAVHYDVPSSVSVASAIGQVDKLWHGVHPGGQRRNGAEQTTLPMWAGTSTVFS